MVLRRVIAEERVSTRHFGPGTDELVRKGLLGRPLVKGDEIMIPNMAWGMSPAPYMVASTVPSGVVTVAEHTEMVVKSEATEEKDTFVPSITYDDLGGLAEGLQRSGDDRLPLKHPELFDRRASTPPKGVRLYGRPAPQDASGKAVANESDLLLLHPRTEIMSKWYGGSEENLREKFDEAAKNAQSIIFIDDIDSNAPKGTTPALRRSGRVVAQLLHAHGRSPNGGQLIVMRHQPPGGVGPGPAPPGTFRREIEVGVPSFQEGRNTAESTRPGMPAGREASLVQYPMAPTVRRGDLSALAREAAMKCLGSSAHWTWTAPSPRRILAPGEGSPPRISTRPQGDRTLGQRR